MNLLYLPILFCRALAPYTASLSQVIVPQVFTLSIIDQAGQWDYVPPTPGQVSLFEPAWRRGAVGLLAHDHLAGALFPALIPGQAVILSNRAGAVYPFRVSQVIRYFFVAPGRLASLDDPGPARSPDEVFDQIYTPGRLVLQTCIHSDQGFFFVIATPFP